MSKIGIADESLVDSSTKALPQESIISNTLTRVLNSESQQRLQHSNEGHLISDLPLVHLHLSRLAERCTYKRCTPVSLSMLQTFLCYHFLRVQKRF